MLELLVGCFLCREQKEEINALFIVIREKLLTAGQPVTLAMFNALVEVFTVSNKYNFSELAAE